MLFSFSLSKVSLQVALLVTFLNDYALTGLQPEAGGPRMDRRAVTSSGIKL